MCYAHGGVAGDENDDNDNRDDDDNDNDDDDGDDDDDDDDDATFFFLDSATQRHCYKLHMLCSLITEHDPSECSVAVHMIVVFSMSAL